MVDPLNMNLWKPRVSKLLPRVGKVPNPLVSDDQSLEVMHILDVFCTWGVAGAPWLEAMVQEVVRQIQSLRSRNLGAYAWARRDFLRMMANLDRYPEPCEIPEAYLGCDPVGILRHNPYRKPEQLEEEGPKFLDAGPHARRFKAVSFSTD